MPPKDLETRPQAISARSGIDDDAHAVLSDGEPISPPGPLRQIARRRYRGVAGQLGRKTGLLGRVVRPAHVIADEQHLDLPRLAVGATELAEDAPGHLDLVRVEADHTVEMGHALGVELQPQPERSCERPSQGAL